MMEVVEDSVNDFWCELKAWDVEATSILKSLSVRNFEYFGKKYITHFKLTPLLWKLQKR